MRGIGRRIALGVGSAAARRRHLRVGEYGILRGLSFRTGSTVGGALSVEDNKENLPPWGLGPRRTLCRQWVRGKKRRPLPGWYPRTPLRDITAIVNAIERRRACLQAISRPRNINTIQEVNSPIGLPDQEESESECKPSNQVLAPSSPLHLVTNSISQGQDSLQSASQSTNTCDPPLELDKKLQELENAVMENLERASKVYPNQRKKTILMSMR